MKATASLELRQIARAVAAAREIVWAKAPPGDITIDFDATLLNVHSEKQDAPPRTSTAMAFIPWAPGATRPRAARVHPPAGNAGPNHTDDHLELLDQAIAALPSEYQVGPPAR